CPTSSGRSRSFLARTGNREYGGNGFHTEQRRNGAVAEKKGFLCSDLRCAVSLCESVPSVPFVVSKDELQPELHLSRRRRRVRNLRRGRNPRAVRVEQ